MIELIIVIFGFVVGWYAREWHATMVMNRFMEKFEENAKDALEQIKENLIKIKIEKHNEGFFVYGLEDNEFMAQGTTRKELEDNLRKRYPGKTFAAEGDNLKEVGFSNESI